MLSEIKQQYSSEMPSQSPKPCVICLEQKTTRDIIHFCCVRCKDGTVCSECARSLWVNNTHRECPVCRNKSQGRTPWIQSYDIEMGEIQLTETNFPPLSIYLNKKRKPLCQQYREFLGRHEQFAIFGQTIIIVILCCFIGYAFKNISGMCYKSKHPECEISFENIVTSIVIGLFVILSLIVFSMIFGICLIICINLGTPEYD